MQQLAQIQKAWSNITASKRFGILPYKFHSLFGYLNKSTNFLQISLKKIENLINGGPNESGGFGEFFEKICVRDVYSEPSSIPSYGYWF